MTGRPCSFKNKTGHITRSGDAGGQMTAQNIGVSPQQAGFVSIKECRG